MSTVSITTADISKLRQQTGAGVMDCKKALEESKGNVEGAIDYLRKKGAKIIAERQHYSSNEGVVVAHTSINHKKGVIIELSCETDFVAKNTKFMSLANAIAHAATNSSLVNKDALMDMEIFIEEKPVTLSNAIEDLAASIKEPIHISKYEVLEGAKVFAYIHSNYRLATLVALSPDLPAIDAIAKDIAMQIAAMNPIAVHEEAIDKKILERECSIAKEQAMQEDKPVAVIEKIVQGKISKFYKERTLLNQDFIKDNSKTVVQILKSINEQLTVTGFKRVALGT